MFKLPLFFLFLFFSLTTIAQTIQIPTNLKLDVPDDYKATEALVLACIDWLVNAEVSDKSNDRKELNAFLLSWTTGSPTVTVELLDELTPLNCQECLIAFIGGWVKYSLENNYSNDKLQCAHAATQSALLFYQNNQNILPKEKKLKKLAKLQKKGKLLDYINSILS